MATFREPMRDPQADALLALVSGRRGHFRLESGHHGGLWLDLDPLFAEPRRVAPFVDRLAAAVRPHAVDAVCGPLLGGAFLAQLVAHALDVAFYFTERVLPPRADGLFPRATACRRRSPGACAADAWPSSTT